MIRNICREFLESRNFPVGNDLDKYRPEGVTESPELIGEGLFAFQLALTTNMINTAQSALGQIDLCLKMARFFQFHLRHITDAGIEQARNVEALSVFAQVKEQTVQNAQGYLGIAIQIYKELGVELDSPHFKRLSAIGNSVKDVAVEADKNRALANTYLTLSAQKNYNIFPEQYKEPLEANETIYGRGFRLAEEFNSGQGGLICFVDDALGSMLARIQYIQQVVIPTTPTVTDKWNEDIDYNIDFLNGILGWQEIFLQISRNNDEFLQRMSP